jgi:hypothetical protein
MDAALCGLIGKVNWICAGLHTRLSAIIAIITVRAIDDAFLIGHVRI